MSGKYKAVGWNRQKKIYDRVLVGTILAVAAAFVGTTTLVNPGYPPETFILRTTSLAAILLLHVILCIGPLARLNPEFLPLLYNRRHLGVTMFFLALIHAVFAIAYYHGQGVVNPLVSVFTAYKSDYAALTVATAISHLPFEPFGAFALIILFLMAATSHDFWLRILGASFWKTLHVGVYVAYGALIAHVSLGVLQSERSPALAALLVAGLVVVIGLHLAAQAKEARVDRHRVAAESDGFIRACAVTDLREGHGKAIRLGAERRAVFLHNGRVYALSNVCRHQGGPVGEGRILDGCITCPWHGWQYLPDTGTSPPPFHEVLDTYPVRVIDGVVFVNPTPKPPEFRSEGAPLSGSSVA
jgi:nitrite reductase/ring-hydroxylating ferredoxin subunit/DMSO/TMAO reductase YedYZ heme-binding membrane subunit